MADVFEDWQKEMTDSQGRRLWVDRICGHKPDAPWIPEPPEGSFAAMRPLSMWDVRLRLFRTIFDTPNLDWLLLTKRPENISRMIADGMNRAWGVPQRQSPFAQWMEDWLTHYKVPANVWLGTSVEDQKTAEERIPHLLKVPAAVRFLSVEPLLGPVNLSDWIGHGIDWVIIGGESGPGARHCNVEWIRDIVNQCRNAGVKVFVKQLGANARELGEAIGNTGFVANPQLKLRDPKGGDMSEWPEDLRVREVPTPGLFDDANGEGD
jgi:protein gp37